MPIGEVFIPKDLAELNKKIDQADGVDTIIDVVQSHVCGRRHIVM
jgi:hypothetical protein